MLFQDRRRAESFGQAADLYERTRPSYPWALVDDLLSEAPRRVLDVGCGTGKASRALAEAGCAVVGVEPDERMAAVARHHGVGAEVATFEAWTPGDQHFDLVVSGQAWHWIDPSIGPVKAGRLLRQGGRLAVFWNVARADAEMRAVLGKVYRRFAPTIIGNSSAGTERWDPMASHGKAITQTGLFDALELRCYHWDHRYTRDEWLDQLSTNSDHRQLPSDQFAALMHALGRAIDSLGRSIPIAYEVPLLTTRRL